jgi:hypothetical protein
MNFQELIRNWEQDERKFYNGARDDMMLFNEGVSVKQIAKLEEELKFQFPKSFRDFYQLADGFRNGHLSQHLLTIWPLSNIAETHDEMVGDPIGPGGFMPFCDYSIHCHYIGFIRGREGIFKSYDSTEPICASFEEALAMIRVGAANVY